MPGGDLSELLLNAPSAGFEFGEMHTDAVASLAGVGSRVISEDPQQVAAAAGFHNGSRNTNNGVADMTDDSENTALGGQRMADPSAAAQQLSIRVPAVTIQLFYNSPVCHVNCVS